MSSLAPLPTSAIVTAPDHSDAVASLRAGHSFTCVLAEDPVLWSAALEAVLLAAADLRTRFVRVGNPLRAPLTLARLLIQAGSRVDPHHDPDPAALTRSIAGPVDDETRVVLVIEQAETLDPEAMQMLRRMSASFASDLPTVQVLFAGHPSFRELLGGGTATPVAAMPLRPILPDLLAAAATVGPRPDVPASAPGPAIPAQAAEPQPTELAEPAAVPASPAARARRGWARAAAGLALLAVLVAGAAWLAYPGLFHQRASSGPAALTPLAREPGPVASPAAAGPAAAPGQATPGPVTPGPLAAKPAAPGPAAPSVPPPAAPETEAAARLRREFDQFLAASGRSTARMPEAQRQTLFQEFLAWRARNPPAEPAR